MKFWKLVYHLGKPVEAVEKLRARKNENPKLRIPDLTLYHYQLSPYALRVRSAVHEMGLDISMIDVLRDSQALSELISEGGKDQVPCLKIQTPGKPTRWLYESGDIIRYLKARLDSQTF
jgi:glutaredoxin 2